MTFQQRFPTQSVIFAKFVVVGRFATHFAPFVRKFGCDNLTESFFAQISNFPDTVTDFNNLFWRYNLKLVFTKLHNITAAKQLTMKHKIWIFSWLLKDRHKMLNVNIGSTWLLKRQTQRRVDFLSKWNSWQLCESDNILHCFVWNEC